LRGVLRCNEKRKDQETSIPSRIVDDLTADAIRDVAEAWSRAESDGALTDGSDMDPERGPEDERTIAGERVRTFIDKVFGGRAVAVLRKEGGRVVEYSLGRVSNHETPSSVLGPELAKSLGLPPRASAPAVVKGVWRNDRNGWVTDQITALTENEAIEQLVVAFKEHRDSGSAKRRGHSGTAPSRSTSQRGNAKPSGSRKTTAKQRPRATNEERVTREAVNQWRLSTELVPRRDLARYVEDLTYVLFLDLPGVEQAAGVCQYLLPLWDMIDNFGLQLDHVKIARRVGKDYGAALAAEYRRAADLWTKKMREDRQRTSH
jgi:hypothetical protein